VSAAEKASMMAEKDFAFAFVEGALVKAVREGWWLLLDEINLAPAEVCLLLPSVAFCCLLLPSVAFCCLLLLSVASCCLLLPLVASCCLLLPSDLYHLPSVAFCCLVWPSVAF
jgi:hypothetical protein